MKTEQRAKNVCLMFETANEIHGKYCSLRSNGEESVQAAKEYVAYCDIFQDFTNMTYTFSRSSNRFSIWCAVRVTQMSIETYIETYGALDESFGK